MRTHNVDFTERRGDDAFKTVYFETLFKFNPRKISKNDLVKKINWLYSQINIDREVFLPWSEDIFVVDTGVQFEILNAPTKQISVSLYLHPNKNYLSTISKMNLKGKKEKDNQKSILLIKEYMNQMVEQITELQKQLK